MTEEEARDWIASRFGSGAVDRVGGIVAAVVAENARQNLIAPSTIPIIWSRHAVDSAQLVPLAPVDGGWIDIGTGGGFPGLIVAALREAETLLVEPRRLRASFLAGVSGELGMDHVEVIAKRVEHVAQEGAVISARAVASAEKLFDAARNCSTPATCWLLPRGRPNPDELAALRRSWNGVFHMKQSVTSSEGVILTAVGVSRR